jgi:hypothetical protein
MRSSNPMYRYPTKLTAPLMVKDVDDIISWNKADPGFLLAAGQRVKEGPGLAAEKHPSGIILIQR